MPGTIDAFMDKVEFSDDGCWLWRAYRWPTGYGCYYKQNAHRWIYEFLMGPIPDGLQLDHLCRVPACVNPVHLEAVTQYVNNMRSDSPAALNARKTTCVNGHPLDGGNTYVTPNKRRQCRKCRAAATARWYLRTVS